MIQVNVSGSGDSGSGAVVATVLVILMIVVLVWLFAFGGMNVFYVSPATAPQQSGTTTIAPNININPPTTGGQQQPAAPSGGQPSAPAPGGAYKP